MTTTTTTTTRRHTRHRKEGREKKKTTNRRRKSKTKRHRCNNKNSSNKRSKKTRARVCCCWRQVRISKHAASLFGLSIVTAVVSDAAAVPNNNNNKGKLGETNKPASLPPSSSCIDGWDNRYTSLSIIFSSCSLVDESSGVRCECGLSLRALAAGSDWNDRVNMCEAHSVCVCDAFFHPSTDAHTLDGEWCQVGFLCSFIPLCFLPDVWCTFFPLSPSLGCPPFME